MVLHLSLQDRRQGNLPQPNMAIRVIDDLDPWHAGEFLRVELLADAFRDDRHPMLAAHHSAFQDCRLQHAADVVQTDTFLRELLGYDRQGGTSCFADAECQMPGLTSHDDHEVPAVRGSRILHQVTNQLGANVSGGLEPEGRYPTGKWQIVINGFRYVGDAHRPVGGIGHFRGSECRIITTDSHQRTYV